MNSISWPSHFKERARRRYFFGGLHTCILYSSYGIVQVKFVVKLISKKYCNIRCWSMLVYISDVLDPQRTKSLIYSMYSQKWNCAASFPIPFMYLWAISIFPGSVCLFYTRDNLEIKKVEISKSNRHTDPGNIKIAHKYMNLEIGRH